MDRLAFTAVVAVNEQRFARQAAVNEMANVGTIGFKRSFESSLRAIKIEGAGAPRYQPQSLTDDFIQLKAGPVMATGNYLDVALEGNAVLGVTAADGQLAFTRRGDLRPNARGVLETGSGHLVRGKDGSPINTPPGLVITIQADGSVFGQDPAQANTSPPVQLGSLLLRDASDTKLQRRTDGLFEVVGQAPGQDITPGPNLPRLTPGALEGSNVNAMTIMVRLMDQSRAFEQYVNVIKESKSVDESSQTMMKAA